MTVAAGDSLRIQFTALPPAGTGRDVRLRVLAPNGTELFNGATIPGSLSYDALRAVTTSGTLRAIVTGGEDYVGFGNYRFVISRP